MLHGLAVAIFSLGRPAQSSLAPRLLPDDEIAAASALSSVYNSLAAVGGPAVGGVLIAAAGVPWTYGIDLVTYIASLVVIWLLPKLPPLGEVDRPSLGSILVGFRFLKGRQPLLGIFAVDTSAMVFGMPTALFPALALHRLGNDVRLLPRVRLDVARPARGSPSRLQPRSRCARIGHLATLLDRLRRRALRRRLHRSRARFARFPQLRQP